MYVSQNGMNILGCDGQTQLSVSIVSVVEPPSPKALQDGFDINAELFSLVLGHCVTM